MSTAGKSLIRFSVAVVVAWSAAAFGAVGTIFYSFTYPRRAA